VVLGKMRDASARLKVWVSEVCKIRVTVSRVSVTVTVSNSN